MPYDPQDLNSIKLPPHVLKRMEPIRKIWIKVFNSVYARTHDEGEAFRIANSKIK